MRTHTTASERAEAFDESTKRVEFPKLDITYIKWSLSEKTLKMCFLSALTVNQHVHCSHVLIEKNINCANPVRLASVLSQEGCFLPELSMTGCHAVKFRVLS